MSNGGSLATEQTLRIRGPQMIQDKERSAVSGCPPLTRTATQDWIICRPPCGRGEKPSSVVLRLL